LCQVETNRSSALTFHPLPACRVCESGGMNRFRKVDSAEGRSRLFSCVGDGGRLQGNSHDGIPADGVGGRLEANIGSKYPSSDACSTTNVLLNCLLACGAPTSIIDSCFPSSFLTTAQLNVTPFELFTSLAIENFSIALPLSAAGAFPLLINTSRKLPYALLIVPASEAPDELLASCTTLNAAPLPSNPAVRIHSP
jgi:hypothetical protein